MLLRPMYHLGVGCARRRALCCGLRCKVISVSLIIVVYSGLMAIIYDLRAGRLGELYSIITAVDEIIATAVADDVPAAFDNCPRRTEERISTVL